MKILVTGANGFIGKNLIAELRNKGYLDVLEINRQSEPSLLEKFTKDCDFVFHLAGVNRPDDESEFMEGNFEFTSKLLQLLKKQNNQSPVVFTSSIQAEQDNPYGTSKKGAENLLFTYGKDSGVKVLVYRLTNIFGKWCKPNYNSAIATFCHNIARDKEIQIYNTDATITLSYIDDVLVEFLKALDGKESVDGQFCCIPVTHKITVGELANKLYSFKKNRDTLIMPSLESALDKALYGTYLSYLEEDNFSYKLKKNEDNRGWLAEFMKSKSMGQIFVSKTKPGITRGKHWHHTKVEKFLVIQGEAIIKFRRIDTDDVLEYIVNGETPEVVDIPVGYTHSITNTGEDELITVFWASETLNPDKPDTYYLEV
jgi:UDP-2-acetamido-2,6-beta-L-arabino-hexul-4-ose reductase